MPNCHPWRVRIRERSNCVVQVCWSVPLVVWLCLTSNTRRYPSPLAMPYTDYVTFDVSSILTSDVTSHVIWNVTEHRKISDVTSTYVLSALLVVPCWLELRVKYVSGNPKLWPQVRVVGYWPTLDQNNVLNTDLKIQICPIWGSIWPNLEANPQTPAMWI